MSRSHLHHLLTNWSLLLAVIAVAPYLPLLQSAVVGAEAKTNIYPVYTKNLSLSIHIHFYTHKELIILLLLKKKNFCLFVDGLWPISLLLVILNASSKKAFSPI